MMKRNMWARIILLIGLFTNLVFPGVYGFQQQDSTLNTPKDWFLRDPETDKLLGVSAERAYELLKGRPSRTVIVAVIDSGIDIDHEDLRDVIWINEKEIAGNGIDDDKNGYIDDIHGWNFIGGKNGNVKEDTYEVTREYKRLMRKYENIDEKKVSKKDKPEYEYWKKIKDTYEKDFKSKKEQYEQYTQHYQLYSNAYLTIEYCDSILSTKLGAPVTKSSLASVNSSNDTIMFAKQTLTKILESVDGDVQVDEFLEELAGVLEQIKEGVEYFQTAVEYGYNLDFDPRHIVGDDPNNLTEKGYGNNDVFGPYALHGTHVAGIIGANRKNDLGIKGIADNVRIMALRAVPNGDERDKDIANAILYAADNGAQIINMSFGKAFSPHKEVVDKAVKYAESKGVLLIHGAGNDGADNDKEENFPNRNFNKGGDAKTWLEIGASAWQADNEFVASFSNYGKKSVDLFAPGVQIYSTTPNNNYEDKQGTSMACPAASGVAAILMSYFPDLSTSQVKDILRQSSRKFDGLKVSKPGTGEIVSFNQLSSTGGLVNAYEAVKMAMAMKRNQPENN